MRVLIACEHSGTVREAFRACGHDAWSCDILPASDGSPHHLQGDCLAAVDGGWDRLIAHPPCTYLTNSAVWALKDPDFERYPGVGYHQRLKPGTLFGSARRAARLEAIAFFRSLLECPIAQICIENPVGCMGPIVGKAAQIIHPYQFGDDASKGTCLWLKGLTPLAGTRYVEPRWVDGKPRWGNQTDSGQNALSPTDDRGHVRSITYPGIAAAMAEQWG